MKDASLALPSGKARDAIYYRFIEERGKSYEFRSDRRANNHSRHSKAFRKDGA
jgi:hypothetical protein